MGRILMKKALIKKEPCLPPKLRGGKGDNSPSDNSPSSKQTATRKMAILKDVRLMEGVIPHMEKACLDRK